MSSQATRIAVMAPAGETPESWTKFKVECLALKWRADARAHSWRSVAYIGLSGWVLFIPLAVQVFAPGIVTWLFAHGQAMKDVVVATVAAIFVYQAVERLRRNAHRVVDCRQKRAVQA